MNLDGLTDAVWKRLEWEKPRALLIGKAPINYHKYIYVNQEPYEVVVLGVLPPGRLLHMPDEIVCQALLDGIPVRLWHEQLHHTGNRSHPLRQALYEAERRLIRYGVQIIGGKTKLITADAARQLLQSGQRPSPDSRMTPLAKDILEGKAT